MDDPLRGAPPHDPRTDLEAELRGSQDPNALLVRWCLEGKPRVAADLAEPHSVVWLAAQLLCDTTTATTTALASFAKPELMAAGAAAAAERRLLHCAFLFKSGKTEEAIAEARRMVDDDQLVATSAWRRRARACLAWLLASTGDYRASLQAVATPTTSEEEEEFDRQDKLALLFVGSWLRTEMGDCAGARRDWEQAKQLLTASSSSSSSSTTANDARLALGEARLCYSEGRYADASQIWLAQCNAPSSTATTGVDVYAPSASTWLACFAVSAVVGNLGDVVLVGSRQAKHEAANNYAVCALHSAGGLEVAIAALEQVIKSYNSSDQIAVSNLKTLYELCRTPATMRLPGI